jgi:hopanoid C-2 methylase
VEWQKRNGYPFYFACEATLNIAKRPEILELMREASFGTVFCGIETPDPDALRAMSKEHNLMVPIVEAIRTLNSYGLEVVSGIILGLDTDKASSGTALLEFIERSNIPMLTINLLQALPRTPLWDRLAREGRLVHDDARESNVDFKLPYEQVLATWRDCMARAYRPEAVFARFAYQLHETYPHRIKLPNSPQRLSFRNIRRAVYMLSRIIWKVGIRGNYRAEFWKFARPLLRRGDIENLIAVPLVAHHLIMFASEAVAGRRNASHYSARLLEPAIAAE